jgi:hypothetical protein
VPLLEARDLQHRGDMKPEPAARFARFRQAVPAIAPGEAADVALLPLELPRLAAGKRTALLRAIDPLVDIAQLATDARAWQATVADERVRWRAWRGGRLACDPRLKRHGENDGEEQNVRGGKRIGQLLLNRTNIRCAS